ncbi:MAG TPA: SAV_6107 family HEPN domain-containing protein [Cellulomonas sp.]|uniref:SAV_6107 family HEPN domain-containing protein n=1 Tax=Cellulomonas sp. TaxID=40001 RepID=UPI002E37520C|nr:SAV_6107 family HEPN domain-containing protein [Cellulomonas sp.]HEX5334180.1 SAV_6107 family HEPN domain-containing protein [Cellulomonas sp.]
MATATGSDLLPTRSHELLQRADAELVAAQFSSEAWERFSHAHLAALRGGAALLAVRGRPGGRRPPRTVWDMLRIVSPELARWSDYFAAGAGLRSAIEAGRFDAVSDARAEQALCAAEDFVDELRALLAADASTTPPVYGAANRPLGLRAS